MRSVFIFLTLLFSTIISFGQLPKKAMDKMGPGPVLFVDSIEVDMSEMQSLNPFDISNITVVKPKKAKKLLGDKGVDGAIYVTTIKSAKQIYWTFFCRKSRAYKELFNSPQADTIVQYVLNRQPLADVASETGLIEMGYFADILRWRRIHLKYVDFRKVCFVMK